MEDKLKNAAEQAGKALGHAVDVASVESNKVVQAEGAKAVSWVQRNQWAVYAFVGLVVVLVVGGLIYRGVL